MKENRVCEEQGAAGSRVPQSVWLTLAVSYLVGGKELEVILEEMWRHGSGRGIDCLSVPWGFQISSGYDVSHGQTGSPNLGLRTPSQTIWDIMVLGVDEDEDWEGKWLMVWGCLVRVAKTQDSVFGAWRPVVWSQGLRPERAKPWDWSRFGRFACPKKVFLFFNKRSICFLNKANFIQLDNPPEQLKFLLSCSLILRQTGLWQRKLQNSSPSQDKSLLLLHGLILFKAWDQLEG